MSLPIQKPDPRRVVALLAEQYHAPMEAVTALYESEIVDLDREARVKAFVHIFAVRKIEETLRGGVGRT